MKSFVFAALFAAALAIPYEQCACKPAVMCPQSFPESCECQMKALQECYEALPKGCPQPKLASCSSNPLGQACGGKDADAKECGSLVCSYEDAKFPVAADAKGKCVKRTETLKQKCDGRGLKGCPDGYECYHEVDPRKVSDIPGVCVVKGFKPASSSASHVPTYTPVTRIPGSTFIPTATAKTTIPTKPTGFPKTCGGIAGLKCPSGFVCQYEKSDPFMSDQAGHCLPVSSVSSASASFTVPPKPTASPKTCGGIAGIVCPTGFVCKFERNEPFVADRTGQCLPANSLSSNLPNVPTPVSSLSSNVPPVYTPVTRLSSNLPPVNTPVTRLSSNLPPVPTPVTRLTSNLPSVPTPVPY